MARKPRDKSGGWLTALGVIFGGLSLLVAIAELTAKKCPSCGQKVVVVNNNWYCNRCRIYVYN